MKLKVYAVFDTAIEAFMQPFFMQARGAALRAFGEIAADKQHAIGKSPQDYCLFELGSWDDATGKFEMHQAPISLGLAIELANKVSV